MLRVLFAAALAIKIAFSPTASSSEGVELPIPEQRAVALVRDALAVLNHANFTGNYTVLRDYGSPNFAAAFSAAELAEIFRSVRDQGIDLFPTTVLAPAFTRGAMIDNGTRLLLSGEVAIDPRPVRFYLIFEPVEGRWRLFGVSIRQIEGLPEPPTAPAEQSE